ncbi:MraY family glycosyltransferase [Alsobacter sp. R-9]
MTDFDTLLSVPALAGVTLACAAAAALVIPPLMPLLRRYALARPNARSSHREPTPQGGGIAVVGVTVVTLALLAVLRPPAADEIRSLAVLLASAVVLAVLGAWDDIRPLPALPRFLVQLLAVGATVAALPAEVRLLPGLLPAGIERGLLVIGGLWFVNLTNFMDGIDWITAAQFVPLSAVVVLLGVLGIAPAAAAVVAAALAGSLLGFAPYNRPVARLFLGDVGSLPIGLLAGYALVRLGGQGALASAAILPLYYLADATITLLRRLARGEKVWEAHRTHFYQRATGRGLTVSGIVTRIFAANLVLGALAIAAAFAGSVGSVLAACGAAVAVVAILMADLVRPRAAVAA